ncbi:MAG: hypothetical protein ACE5EA_02995 [Nitrospirota bacterium]
MGCGDNNVIGVSINGSIDDLTEVNPKGGDNDDDYIDKFITPPSLMIGLKSAKLILENEQSPSYTIFDTNPLSPMIVELVRGLPLFIANNSNYPSSGTYNKVQYEIIFYEVIIPVCERTVVDCPQRRMRVYLSQTLDPQLGPISAGDILIEEPPLNNTFKWINKSDGSYSDFRPADNLVHQVPLDKFSSIGKISTDNIFSGTVSLSTPLIIPTSPSGLSIIEINFDIKDLFFYDDTNSNDRFDPFPILLSCDLDCDGHLDGANPSADYYPALPSISAAISE